MRGGGSLRPFWQKFSNNGRAFRLRVTRCRCLCYSGVRIGSRALFTIFVTMPPNCSARALGLHSHFGGPKSTPFAVVTWHTLQGSPYASAYRTASEVIRERIFDEKDGTKPRRILTVGGRSQEPAMSQIVRLVESHKLSIGTAIVLSSQCESCIQPEQGSISNPPVAVRFL